jgi:hypothetical protein
MNYLLSMPMTLMGFFVLAGALAAQAPRPAPKHEPKVEVCRQEPAAANAAFCAPVAE